MLNGKSTAWKDKAGKILTLAPRVGMRAIGKGKKAPKAAAKKNIVVMKKAAKKSLALPMDGKTAAGGGR
jgi:hypothetical protein